MNPTQLFLYNNFRKEATGVAMLVMLFSAMNKEAQDKRRAELADCVQAAAHSLWYVKQTTPRELFTDLQLEVISAFEDILRRVTGEGQNLELPKWAYDASGTTPA